MSWQNIIRRLTELGLFLLVNPLYLLAIAVVITIFLFIGGIRSCQSKHQEKISNIQENITVEKVETNSLTNQKENIKREVKNAENNSNQAVNNFNHILRRDSNQYQGTDAGKRFCEKFPEDSSCR